MSVGGTEYNHDVGDREIFGSYIGYDEWQSALSDEFFPTNQPGEPVIMFLDDEEMARICPLLPDPVGSLRSAVLAELRQTDKATIFDPIERRLASWRKGPQDHPPPCLPLLAVTVIAGSRMRNDGQFSSAAYYPRLVNLMTSGTNRLTASGIQKHFDVVAGMWQTLDDWIERSSDLLGPSTIHRGTFNRIGYPLSQTVLKASDRDRLSGFFDRLGVDRNSMPSPDRLLALLRMWLDKPRGFSTAFVELVQKSPGNPLLLAVISKLAAEQSSGPAVANGRVRLDLSMCINPEDWSVSWVIPVDRRLDTDELSPVNGSPFSIQKPDYGSVYDVVTGCLPQSPSLIGHRFRALGARAVLTKNVRQIWILRIDPSSGHWQSVSNVTLDEPHLFVVQDTDAAEVAEILTKNAAPGHWKLRGKIFPGWDVYVDVSFLEPIDLAGGGAGAFNSLGQLLTALPSSRPKLLNGLELQTDVGGRHYLLGGEPDVQLPEEFSDGYVQVVLDNRLPGTRMKANGSLFPLRLAGPFTEGKHTVSVGDHTLDFFVHTVGSAAQWEGSLAEDRDNAGSPGPVPKAGAPEYVLCRRGRDAAVWFVAPSGAVRRCGEPPVPPFITGLGFPLSYQWKAPVPQGTAWVLTERSGKLSQPQQIAADPPNFGSLQSLAQAFWRRAASETIGSQDRLWRSYLSQSMEDSIHGR